MLRNLFSFQQTKELLTHLAAGDLTEDGLVGRRKMGPLDLLVLKTVRGLRPLIRVVENSVSRLHLKMEELESRSRMVTEHAAGVNAAIGEMAAAVQDSAERAQQVAADISDISGLLVDIRRTQTQLSQFAERLTGIAGEGQAEMTHAAERMGKVGEENAAVGRKMKSLDEAVANISGILRLVQDISNQTQILSLNAGIEAARAGDHGRGFTIVAQEVGRLARQTKDAVLEIERQLESVSGCKNELQSGIRRMNEETETGIELMSRAYDRYGVIVSDLNAAGEQIREAERKIEDIERKSVDVTDAMQSVSAMVEQTAAGIEEVLASSMAQQETIEDMRSLIQDALRSGLSLRSAVSQFKLPPEEAGGAGGKFRQLAHDWIETALQIRVMMVTVFEIADRGKLDGWYRELCRHDDWLKGIFARLAEALANPKDRESFEHLGRCWEAYVAARNKNVKLIFEGDLDRAKEGVTNEARERFKRAMDQMYEWLETSYQGERSKLA